MFRVYFKPQTVEIISKIKLFFTNAVFIIDEKN